MKKLGLILLAATLLLTMTGSLVSCGEPEPDEPVVLKMASAATGNYQPTEQAFCDAFNARCGPDYTIEYFGAEAMLTFPELLDGVRTGAADMGVIHLTSTPLTNPNWAQWKCLSCLITSKPISMRLPSLNHYMVRY